MKKLFLLITTLLLIMGLFFYYNNSKSFTLSDFAGSWECTQKINLPLAITITKQIWVVDIAEMSINRHGSIETSSPNDPNKKLIINMHVSESFHLIGDTLTLRNKKFLEINVTKNDFNLSTIGLINDLKKDYYFEEISNDKIYKTSNNNIVIGTTSKYCYRIE